MLGTDLFTSLLHMCVCVCMCATVCVSAYAVATILHVVSLAMHVCGGVCAGGCMEHRCLHRYLKLWLVEEWISLYIDPMKRAPSIHRLTDKHHYNSYSQPKVHKNVYCISMFTVLLSVYVCVVTMLSTATQYVPLPEVSWIGACLKESSSLHG